MSNRQRSYRNVQLCKAHDRTVIDCVVNLAAMGSTFREEATEAFLNLSVCKVGPITYGEIAAKMGEPKNARNVGRHWRKKFYDDTRKSRCCCVKYENFPLHRIGTNIDPFSAKDSAMTKWEELGRRWDEGLSPGCPRFQARFQHPSGNGVCANDVKGEECSVNNCRLQKYIKEKKLQTELDRLIQDGPMTNRP